MSSITERKMNAYESIPEGVITHMLGYLNFRQWIDAVKNSDIELGDVLELAEIQERVYGVKLVEDIKRQCNENNI